MAITRVDWLNDGTLPQTKSSGNWTPADFNAGKIRFTLTFAAASTGSPWRPTSPTYWAVLTTNESNGSALWIEYLPSTGVHTLIFVASDGTTILGSRALTWTASDDVTITIDQSSATAGASTMTLAGAATGDGTTAGWTRASVFSGSELRFGGWAGSSTFNLPAGSVTTSDIDDGNDSTSHDRAAVFTGAVDLEVAGRRTHNRTAAVSAAATVSVSGQRTFHRAAAVAAAVTLAVSGQVSGGATTHARAATISGAVDLEVAGQRTHNRAATVTGAADLEIAGRRTFHRAAAVSGAVDLEVAGAIAGDAMTLGGYGAARVLYGTAAGTVSVTITTEASGSTFLLAVGGNLSDLATPPTDSEGNTWTEVGSFEFTQWAGYGCVYYQAPNGIGAGGSHTFSQQFGQTLGFDECTIAVVEIRNAIHVEDFASGESASGSTVNTPSVTSQDACEWVVFSTGDAPTGSTAAYSPSNGLTVIHDTTGVDHPNGYVPIILLHASKASAGTYTSAIGISPAQRLGLGVFAVQAANTIARSISVTGAVDLEIAGRRSHNRTAAVAGAADLEAVGRLTHNRAAAATAAVDVELAGLVTRQRSAAFAAAVDVEIAGLVTRQRSAAFTGAVNLEVAGVATHQRAIAVTGAVDLEIAGAVLPSGATQHSRSAVVTGAVDLAVAGQVTRQRAVVVTGAVELEVAGRRTHNRAAAVTAAVNLEVAGRLNATTRTTTVAAIRDAIIARIVGLVPTVDSANRWIPHDDVDDLRSWAVRAPAAAYRRFSVEPSYTTEAPIVSSVDLEQVVTSFEVVVAYPARSRWVNRRGLFDVVDSDRRRLEYEVGTASRSGAGFDPPATLISRALPAPEEAEGVVFASLLIDATYWRTAP